MKQKFLCILFIIILLFTSCLSQNQSAAPLDGKAAFHFIDVGQGDCILIRTDHTAILIDAGISESGNTICEYIESFGIDYLDCFIATHPHEDHMGGSSDVIKNFKIGKIFVNEESSSAFFYEKFIDALLEKEIVPEIPDMHCVYEIGDLKLKFLSPKKDYEDTNDNSLVTMIEYGETRALFTGDAEKNVEMQLAAEADISADILKVGHHGSRNASTSGFLHKVLPAVCVIQCGKDNSYGHPHEEAVNRIEKIGSEILRTDQCGNIILYSDGKQISDNLGNIYEPLLFNPEDISYIGNKKSKTLHTEDCPNLPGEKNRIIFSSRKDALEGGYSPCGNCNP